jgi:hypothetical protein
MKIVRTKTSEMFLDEHGILHKTVIENSHADLATLKESEEATHNLTKGERVLELYDARNHFTLTEDAMQYAQKEILNKQRIATAIVSNKVAIKIMVDFIMNVLKSETPIKIFNTKEAALKWLLTFKTGEGNKDSRTDKTTRSKLSR